LTPGLFLSYWKEESCKKSVNNLMKQKMLPGKGKKGLTGKQCDQGGQMSL
jgi:hypothetical protein